MSHLKPSFVRERFPNIYRRCLDLGLDITKKAIPVVPAAHYMCGGVMTDLQGRTDLIGLWAAGEVSSTGLHGANRLASNSLLEAMYFADIGSRSAARALKTLARRMPNSLRALQPPDVGPIARGGRHWTVLRGTMWDDVGIIRDRAGLTRAQSKLRHLIKDAEHRYRTIGTNADTIEFRSAALVGWLIAHSALSRRESRGLHERTDFPHTDDQNYRHDTIVTGRG
jgi:L-aspartate oxidase